MEYFEALFLGAVQGLTEFLPISSSGHLIFFEKLFDIDSPSLLMNIIFHLGTMVSIIIVFRKELFALIRKPFCPLMFNLVVTTAITCFIAVLIKVFLGDLIDGKYIGFGFIFTAFMLFCTWFATTKKTAPAVETCNISNIKFSQILVMGVAQGIATIGGISRSGSTIGAGVIMGGERKKIGEFSFIMSIPVVIASMVFELMFDNSAIISIDFWTALIGFSSSLIFGIFAIGLMKKIIGKSMYFPFIIYLIIMTFLSFVLIK